MKHVSVTKQLGLTVVLICIAMVGIVVNGIMSLNSTFRNLAEPDESLQINGSIYKSIIYAKDATADVLPPPCYVIESYLTAYELSDATDQNQIQALLNKLAGLKKEYDDRQTYWTTELTDGDELKVALTDTAHKPATAFFTCLQDEFMPAVVAGDSAQAKSVLREKLSALYVAQREGVDAVVALSNKRYAADQALLVSKIEENKEAAKAALSAQMKVFVGIAGSAVVATILLVVLVIRSMTKRLNAIVGNLREGAAQMSSASRQVSDSSQQMASGASEQASSLEETSASLEQMASMIKQNSDNARQASGMATTARDAAQDGRQAMERMSGAIQKIKGSSDETARSSRRLTRSRFRQTCLR